MGELSRTSVAEQRLCDQITMAGPGTLAAGAKLSTEDVWTVLNQLNALRLEYAELEDAYEEIKRQHDRCF